jgi:DNA mismatch endonuclease Vsr
MRLVRTVGTGPERRLRALLHARGYWYRVNRRPVAGIRCLADLVFAGPKVAVFVDGCFWHGCPDHASWPKHDALAWTVPTSARSSAASSTSHSTRSSRSRPDSTRSRALFAHGRGFRTGALPMRQERTAKGNSAVRLRSESPRTTANTCEQPPARLSVFADFRPCSLVFVVWSGIRGERLELTLRSYFLTRCGQSAVPHPVLIRRSRSAQGPTYAIPYARRSDNHGGSKQVEASVGRPRRQRPIGMRLHASSWPVPWRSPRATRSTKRWAKHEG